MASSIRRLPTAAVQIGQHVPHQRFDVHVRQQGRYLAHHQLLGALAIDFETERGKPRLAALGLVGFGARHRHAQGHQQRLRPDTLFLVAALEMLIADALVGGMHIHQHQSVGILRQYIDAFELRQGEAQRRRYLSLALGRRFGLKGHRGRSQRAVAVQAQVLAQLFVDRERHAGLAARDEAPAASGMTAGGGCAALRAPSGRIAASAWCTLRNRKSCTRRDSRKRTSCLAGCALTSTAAGSSSR